jgi:SAM-dependent methyltransferase
VVAVDVSPTALQLARTSYESLHVVAARVPPLPFATASFDLVIASHLLWCVLPDLTKLFEEIGRTLTPGGRCLVVQTFYKPGEQRYGNEVIEQPEDLIRLIPFRVVRTVEIDRFSNHKLVALAERD